MWRDVLLVPLRDFPGTDQAWKASGDAAFQGSLSFLQFLPATFPPPPSLSALTGLVLYPQAPPVTRCPTA